MSKKTARAAASDDGARESTLASGWTVHADPAVAAPATEAHSLGLTREPDSGEGEAFDTAVDQPGAHAQIANGALVLMGVFGGLFLMYAWGWFIVADAYSSLNLLVAAGSGLIGEVLQQIVFWIAPAAPILWFLAAVLIHRQSTAKLGLWLFLGAVVLIPVPMFVAGGGAA